jgi:preprotein translocase subunit YajC
MNSPAELVINGFFAMGAATDSGGSPWLQLVPFVLVLGIFYFIILLPMRKKQQKVQAFLEGLKVGDKVVTTGGIYGHVTRISGDTVQLQIADKVRIDVSKASVGGLQGQPQVQDAEASQAKDS